MHLDLNKGTPGRLDCDVAIIGAGAAGITAARRLLAAGLHVILLESGGLDYEPATSDLNAGPIVGGNYYPLDHARLRLFGGTTAVWGGRCAELDPIDFEPRHWVPHSGWPLKIHDLRSYYAEARLAFGLPTSSFAAEYATEGLPDFDPEELATRAWLFDDQFDRFSFARCSDLIDHPRCTVITHATVREIVAVSDAGAIESLDVRSLHGWRLQVVAGDYVLAAGGIENARLLLASRSVMPQGLGNAHDQVGRYFMEHPHARGGRIVDGAAWQLLHAFSKRRIDGVTVAPLITPSPSLQAREGLLNSALTIAARRPVGGSQAWPMRAYLYAKHRTAPTQSGRSLWKATKRMAKWVQRQVDPARPWLLHRAGRLELTLVVRAEQSPDPNSRVILAQETDAMGVPRAALDWRTSRIDVDSAAGLVAALGREASRLGLGKVEAAPWLSDQSGAWVTDSAVSAHPIGGYHHMGTTRMSDDPRRGVTDGNGRVHGIGNLHVAGSSLFPTSGWANPTLTIVALALRTADAIAAQASKPALSVQRHVLAR